MSIFNQGIPEPSAQNSVTAIADGDVVVGTPVIVYRNGTSGYNAKNNVLAATAVLGGQIPGIVMKTTSSGKAVDICVAGKVAVAVSSGTVGQFITAIAASGACTTMTAASAIGAANIYGYYNATKEVILSAF